MNTLKQLNNIIESILNCEPFLLTPEDTIHTVEGWDSLVSVQIMTAVMNEFSLDLTFDDIDKFYSVHDILSVIEKVEI